MEVTLPRFSRLTLTDLRKIDSRALSSLIAVLGPESVHKLRFAFVLSPVLLGALIMCAIAVIGNNLFGDRRYPTRWI